MPDEERRIVLVRHAKAVPKDETEDFDRGLADRGRADALLTGRWLAGSGYAVDLALCSSARRTRQTWQLMLPAFAAPPPTAYEDALYRAGADELLGALRERSDDLTGVLLVGHNPAVHELARQLCGDGPQPLLDRLADSFPTSAVAVLTVRAPWADLAPGSARLAAFWSPGD
ncbi:histidine phosphatase family protein [Streptomyces bambusae]|uniref:Histidine phosphatase family protein n=1 Tax=Streptomyces bambusae TaxID=1550616 RepID=A0ABS6ZGC0_9ACTN|nr:histidine phosphatase family protein [Streptomyces bambusae]